MKKSIPVIIILLLITTFIKAQTETDKKNAEALNVLVGGSFAKPKILPAITKLGIAQITVNYRLTSTVSTIGKEKETGKMAGAKLTAYLETSDGELTESDFQEVTDHFYSYFQKKLKASGIDTVGWNTITGTEFYKGADEKLATNEEEKSQGQVWVTHNANKGNILYGGITPFAFGKIKKASTFSEQIGGPAAFFHLTLDFVDIMVNVDIKTKQSSQFPSEYAPLKISTEWKYEAAAKPDMKLIQAAFGNTLLWNEKSQSESIGLSKPIEGGMRYHTEISQDPSRLKSKAFAFAKAMNPVVIVTTREQYKAAAKKALENYADAFVAKVAVLKAGK